MNFLSEISSPSLNQEGIQETKERIQLQIHFDPCSPELIVNHLASIEGPVDIYCWYEGSQYLPQLGASFMKESIFEPLYKLKQDAKLYLYSLKGWDFKKNIANMSSHTPLGKAINRINKAAIECIYSFSFFQFCINNPKEGGLYEFLNENLPKKKWLFNLSKNQRKRELTIAKLFNDQASLFDSINLSFEFFTLPLIACDLALPG